MNLKIIGRVRNEHSDKPEGGWKDVISRIHIRAPYAEALRGLDEFSHIMVLCWFDRVTEEDRISRSTVHPMGKKHIPKVGVFATHSPVRPNPIATTVCRLLQMEKTTLTVRGLDAYDGTPVVDIKSWTPVSLPKDTQHPAWIDEISSSSL